MARYVILSHDHPTQHWDLMLEAGERLRTWRLAAMPAPGASMAAELLQEHRLDYLEYEGPVSGGRGSVSRWDRGRFTWTHDLPDEIEVEVQGERLRCRLRLARENGTRWNCVFESSDSL